MVYSKTHRNGVTITQVEIELFAELLKKGVPIYAAGRKCKMTEKMAENYIKKFRLEHVSKTGPRCGNLHPGWKGGRITNKNGYVRLYMPDHPTCIEKTKRSLTGKTYTYVWEHRVVIEKAIGRFLYDNEIVHHRNGIRSDNRLSNLELFSSNSDHLRCELSGKCPKWTPLGKHRLRETALLRKGKPFGKALRDDKEYLQMIARWKENSDADRQNLLQKAD